MTSNLDPVHALMREHDQLKELLHSAEDKLRAAVLAERAACVHIVEKADIEGYHPFYPSPLRTALAALIRARSQP